MLQGGSGLTRTRPGPTRTYEEVRMDFGRSKVRMHSDLVRSEVRVRLLRAGKVRMDSDLRSELEPRTLVRGPEMCDFGIWIWVYSFVFHLHFVFFRIYIWQAFASSLQALCKHLQAFCRHFTRISQPFHKNFTNIHEHFTSI